MKISPFTSLLTTRSRLFLRDYEIPQFFFHIILCSSVLLSSLWLVNTSALLFKSLIIIFTQEAADTFFDKCKVRSMLRFLQNKKLLVINI